MPLENLKRKIASLQRFDVVKETSDIINENGTFISNLLKRQLSKGTDGDGKPVTLLRHGRVYPYYSDATIREKERKGQEVRWVTNHDSGVFYNSIYVYASGSSFIFDSDVPYFPDILVQSGTRIMELDKVSLEEFKELVLLPQLRARFALANV